MNHFRMTVFRPWALTLCLLGGLILISCSGDEGIPSPPLDDMNKNIGEEILCLPCASDSDCLELGRCDSGRCLPQDRECDAHELCPLGSSCFHEEGTQGLCVLDEGSEVCWEQSPAQRLLISVDMLVLDGGFEGLPANMMASLMFGGWSEDAQDGQGPPTLDLALNPSAHDPQLYVSPSQAVTVSGSMIINSIDVGAYHYDAEGRPRLLTMSRFAVPLTRGPEMVRIDLHLFLSTSSLGETASSTPGCSLSGVMVRTAPAEVRRGGELKLRVDLPLGGSSLAVLVPTPSRTWETEGYSSSDSVQGEWIILRPGSSPPGVYDIPILFICTATTSQGYDPASAFQQVTLQADVL